MKSRYFMSQKQMNEARHIQDVMNSKLKRNEIKELRNLRQCPCGCGVE